MNNSNYDNFHDGGDFLHAYVQIFWLKTRNAENEYISFYIQLNIFFYMKISYTFC